MLRRITFSVFVLLLSTIMATDAQERTSAQVGRDVNDALNRYPQFTIFDGVEATVNQGQVLLTGWVTAAHKRDDIEKRIRGLPGVDRVDNHLQVLPVSQTDDDLRFRIARAIYGNSAFWNYAAMANPPIHIVVNQGRVSLHGTVNTDIDRQLAKSLAAGTGVVDIRNELRTHADFKP